MAERPDPQIPAEADIRDLPALLLYKQLGSSTFAARASGDEFRAAVLLWLAAADQVPAGSLPDCDVELAFLAGYGRDVAAWQEVREGALYGFVLHSDDRLYHHFLTEVVLDAWERKCKDRSRKQALSEAGRRGGLKARSKGGSKPGSKAPSKPKLTVSRTRNKRTDKDKEHMSTFEARLKESYPKRAGSQAWPGALQAANARRKEGHTDDTMLAGVARYADYCSKAGILGTEYVMQAKRFLGPGLEFDNEWNWQPKTPERTGRRGQEHARDQENDAAMERYYQANPELRPK